MKKFYLSIALAAIALTMAAQDKLDMRARTLAENPRMSIENTPRRIDSQEVQLLTSPQGVRMVGVSVKIDSDEAIEQLEAKGADITLRVGDYVYCSIPVDSLIVASEIEEVQNISLSRRRRLLNNLARQATNVTAVHAGTNLPQAYTGEGVVVGLFDGGLDPNHINFYDSQQAATRVERVFNFTTNTSTGRTTVKTYTAGTVSDFTTDDEDETHGTHVLGIAAGAYAKGATDYHGMAPDATLAISCGSGYDAEILDGVQKIIEYAESQGKPAVINLSLGTNLGHHDGTDAFCQSIDELAKRATICIAAGNEGDLNIAVKKTATTSDLEMKTFLVPNSSLSYQYPSYQAYGDVEIICEDNTAFSLTLGIYDTTQSKLVYQLPITSTTMKYVGGSSASASGTKVTNSTFNSAYDSESYFGGQIGRSPDNNRYVAYVTFDLYNASTSGRYLPAIIVKGVAGKRYEMYSDGYYTDFSNKNISGWDKPTGDGTINDMACGKNTLIVGGYTTRNSSPIYTGQIVGDVLNYSSWGTLTDGRELPHICAPGQALISSFSKYYIEDSSEYSSSYEPKKMTVTANNRKHYWSHMGGTSMATPVMTGVAALWLQANPELTPDEIRNIAIRTASTDSYVTGGKVAESPVQWGAGKLDALAGLKDILAASSVEQIIDNGNSHILITQLNDAVFEIFGASETNMAISLISMSGTTVKHITGAGDTVTLDASDVQPGVYVLSVVGAHGNSVQKVMIR